MQALDGVSLSIGGGENVLVVGRTGSGKSSLLTALLRLHPLAGGRILIDGVDVSHLPLQVAIVPRNLVQPGLLQLCASGHGMYEPNQFSTGATKECRRDTSRSSPLHRNHTSKPHTVRWRTHRRCLRIETQRQWRRDSSAFARMSSERARRLAGRPQRADATGCIFTRTETVIRRRQSDFKVKLSTTRHKK